MQSSSMWYEIGNETSGLILILILVFHDCRVSAKGSAHLFRPLFHVLCLLTCDPSFFPRIWSMRTLLFTAFCKMYLYPAPEPGVILIRLVQEKRRQKHFINLIPSENFTSQAVLDALGSVMQSKTRNRRCGARLTGPDRQILGGLPRCTVLRRQRIH